MGRLVAEALQRLELPVQLASLEEARSRRQNAELIFSMCQGPQALEELTLWKKEGCLIVNDPMASRRTYRDVLCAQLTPPRRPRYGVLTYCPG